MRIEREDLLRLGESLRRSWLLTNGRGDYAASSTLLCPTSRHHGLLMTTPDGRTSRHAFLQRFEETLAFGGREFPLSLARYGGGVLHPEGHRFVASFDARPHPTWTYAIGDVELTREVALAR